MSARPHAIVLSRRPSRPVAVWLLTASLVAACTAPAGAPGDSDVDPNGELTTQMRSIPAQIDPQRSGNAEQVRHAAMVFEALMTLDPQTLRPVPAAAKDHPRVSEDGLTYTFTLRDGLKYSDGSPLAAKDFVYAFSRLCDPAIRTSPPAIWRIVVGCQSLKSLDLKNTPADALSAAKSGLGLRANGDREFVVNLIEPASYFTVIAASSVGYPVREADVAKAGAAYGTEISTFIGNGPFKLVERKANERLVFERNENYRTPAKLKRWTKVVVPDELAFAAYRNNEIDAYGGLPSGRAGSVGQYREVIEADAALKAQVFRARGAFTDLYLLNVSRPPFTDKKVRQAFAKALDREAQVRELAKAGAPAFSLIPPGRPGHDPDDTFQMFDAEKARELLRSSAFAGSPELSSIKITYRTADQQGRTLAEWPQQQFKRNLGVQVGVEGADPLTLAQMSASPRTAPQIMFWRWIGDPDPAAWLTAAFHSAGGGDLATLVGYKNDEFDALVRTADRERDTDRRMDLYRRASRILSEDAVAIFLQWFPNEYLRRPWVRGVTDSGADFEYGLLRLHEIYVTKRH